MQCRRQGLLVIGAFRLHMCQGGFGAAGDEPRGSTGSAAERALGAQRHDKCERLRWMARLDCKLVGRPFCKNQTWSGYRN